MRPTGKLLCNTFFGALIAIASATAAQAEPLVVHLWENGAPGFEKLRDVPEKITNGSVSGVNNPSITVFLPPKEKANGAGVLIFPGGGFRQIGFNGEGVVPAHYWNDLGVAAFVCKYRLPRETNSPYSLNIHPRQDGQRAMRVIRSHAAEWGVDPKRIGIEGFSAGGEMTSYIAFSPPAGDPNATDPIDRLDASASFQVVIYPGPLGIPTGGVDPKVPPAFFVIANDDTFHLDAVLSMVEKYRAVKRPMELHVYEVGGHGFGTGTHSKFKSIRTWQDRLTDWLNDNEILK
jgi:acetyl esterase/lipase